MTQSTTLQDSTFDNFESFPSADGHRFTAISTMVQVLNDPEVYFDGTTYVEAEAVIEIAFGGSVVSIPFRTIASRNTDGTVNANAEEHAEALADLKFLKEKVDEFYTEAVRAFAEFPTA